MRVTVVGAALTALTLIGIAYAGTGATTVAALIGAVGWGGLATTLAAH